MPDTAVRLRDLLAEAAARLHQAGSEDGTREAWRLWCELRDDSHPGTAWLDRDRAVPAALAAGFEGALARRLRGEPLAHVTGRVGFRRLLLRSDGRALIPRPETEGLVELLLARIRTGRVIDVGTGSGCIALSLADEGAFQHVIGSDRSRAALALARQNREATGLPVDLVHGNLLDFAAAGSFDAVISNPPYLTAEEYRVLDPGVREWEPKEALASGGDGLLDTRRLLLDGRRVLRAGGWMAMELDCTRAASTALLATQAGWGEVTVLNDLFGRARYLLAQRSTNG